MIEAYKIGTTFVLNDLVGPKLLALSKQFLKLEEQSAALNRAFKRLGGEQSGIRVAAGAARALDVNLGRAQMQAAMLGARLDKLKTSGLLSDKTKALHGEFAKAEASAAKLGMSLAMVSSEATGVEAVAASARALARWLGQASGRATTLHTQLAQIKAMGALPQMPNLPSRYVPGRGGYGGGHGGLLHGGNVHVGPDGVGLGGVGIGLGGMAGMTGMAGMAAAFGAYALGKASISEAAKYQREQKQFEMFGMSAAQNAEAMRFVEQTKMPGASKIDKLRYMTEAQGVFRESGMSGDEALEGAKRVAPMLAKLHYASLLSGHEMSEADEKAMLRFVESTGGLKSPAELNRIANMGFKVTMTSGGNVDWEQLRQAARTGGTAFKGLNDEAKYAWGEPLIGEMKGSSFGTALTTAYNRMNGVIKLPNQVWQEMKNLGLWDRSKVVENSQGGIKQMLGNPLKHADEYAANPFKYYADYIKPIYDQRHLTEAERNRENAMIFGNTGSRMFGMLEQQLETIKNSLPALKQAGDLDTGVKKADETWDGQVKEFQSAWSDFKSEFGKNMLPGATNLLKSGTELLRSVDDFMAKNGKLLKDLGGIEFHPGVGGFGRYAYDTARVLWNDLHGDGSKKPDTVAAPSSQPMQANITVNIDGKEVGKHVASVVFKPTRSGAPLGSGMFDMGIHAPNSHNGF